MKVAVLLTGGHRTFRKCKNNILNNLVKPNDAKVFALMEGDEKFKQEVDSFFCQFLGKSKNLKTCKTPELIKLSEYLLATQPGISKEVFSKVGWSRDFLLHGSGSLIEYYQLLKAYDLLLQYERENNCTFDIIVRCRFDLYFGYPFNFVNFFTQQKPKWADGCQDLYRRSMGSRVMHHCLKNKLTTSTSYLDYSIDTKFTSNNLLKDFNTKNYIWVLGLNQFCMAKRHVFDKIYSLILHYGKYKTNNKFTFNAETQFVEHCKHHNIKIFAYYSKTDALTFASKKSNNNLWDDDFPLDFTMSILREKNGNFPKP